MADLLPAVQPVAGSARAAGNSDEGVAGCRREGEVAGSAEGDVIGEVGAVDNGGQDREA